MKTAHLALTFALSIAFAGCGTDETNRPAPDCQQGQECPSDTTHFTESTCGPGGPACVPDCPASNELPNGVPCIRGDFDPATCQCVPLTIPCPTTGIACVADCPASGQLPSGAPCKKGNYDERHCICIGVPPACPPTGIACLPDCPASGQLPNGTFCNQGTFDEETCTCESK